MVSPCTELAGQQHAHKYSYMVWWLRRASRFFSTWTTRITATSTVINIYSICIYIYIYISVYVIGHISQRHETVGTSNTLHQRQHAERTHRYCACTSLSPQCVCVCVCSNNLYSCCCCCCYCWTKRSFAHHLCLFATFVTDTDAVHHHDDGHDEHDDTSNGKTLGARYNKYPHSQFTHCVLVAAATRSIGQKE